MPLDLEGTETRAALKEAAQGPSFSGSVTTDEGKASGTYTWRNGWGVTGYIKKKWKGNRPVEAGAEVTWEPKK